LTGFVDSNGNYHYAFITSAGHIVDIIHAASGSWSYVDLTSASGAVTVQGTGLGGFATSGDLHWIFQSSSNNHILQIVYTQSTGRYAVGDVTSASGAPTPEQKSAASGFLDTSNNQHFLFQLANGHVYQIYFTGSFNWGDITAVTSGAPTGQEACGFATSSDQHFVYVGSNNHIYQIVYTYSSHTYGYEDITAASGAPSLY
jgi:hypothetical protein